MDFYCNVRYFVVKVVFEWCLRSVGNAYDTYCDVSFYTRQYSAL